MVIWKLLLSPPDLAPFEGGQGELTSLVVQGNQCADASFLALSSTKRKSHNHLVFLSTKLCRFDEFYDTQRRGQNIKIFKIPNKWSTLHWINWSCMMEHIKCTKSTSKLNVTQILTAFRKSMSSVTCWDVMHIQISWGISLYYAIWRIK